MKAFAALFAVAVLVWGSRAAAEDVDVVVLTHGSADDVRELAGLRTDVTARLRALGLTQLANPGLAFEERHSRAAREPNQTQLERWWRELLKARDLSSAKMKNPARVAQLALEMVRELADVPEAILGSRTAEAVHVMDDAHAIDRMWALAVCFEGVEAYKEMHRLEEAAELLEYCSGLSWLVTGKDSVKPTVRSIILRDVAPHRITLRVAPSDRELWLQGNELRPGVYDIRARPGARLAATAACDGIRRVHWVTAAADGGNLQIAIDCAFDDAVHTEGGRLWLSSSSELVEQHAKVVGQVLGARSLVLVSKKSGHYVLQRVFADARPGESVSLPTVHTVGDLDRAVAALLHQKPATAAGPRSSAVVAMPQPAAAGSARGMLWSGVALTIAGLGAEATAWALYGRRAQDVSELVDDGSELGRGEAESWKRARGPVLGLGIAGAATAVGGVALVVTAVRPGRVPWWVAAIVGGAGAGLATWGAVDVAKGQSCSVEQALQCHARELQQDRGVLLLANAAPLLSLLLAKGIGSAVREKSGLRVRAAVGPAGAHVAGVW